MKDLPRLLDAFRETLRCGAVVWMQPDAGRPLVVVAAAPAPVEPPPVASLPPEGRSGCVRTADGEFLAAAVPGPRRAWIAVGPTAECDRVTLAGLLSFLALVVGQYLQSTLEVEHAASELAERYEEINLLYTTSEILGRTVTLAEAAATILTEISETVG
ncbi:MAG TPA: hypothetical protein VFY16_12380, partial [Gemmatimonadaceae bacterium]|nr:hypothetical protein [Gemmatimonadaceae bacterium]